MQTLIKTLQAESGELYAVRDGRRTLLATSAPRVEIYEHARKIPVLGKTNYPVKSHIFSLVVCPGEDTTRKVDEDFLRSIARFDLTADIQREDGIFERIYFEGMIPREINLPGDWVFESDDSKLIKKLLAL